MKKRSCLSLQICLSTTLYNTFKLFFEVFSLLGKYSEQILSFLLLTLEFLLMKHNSSYFWLWNQYKEHFVTIASWYLKLHIPGHIVCELIMFRNRKIYLLLFSLKALSRNWLNHMHCPITSFSTITATFTFLSINSLQAIKSLTWNKWLVDLW